MDVISFGEHLLRQIDAEIAAIEQHIVSGVAQDYTEYKCLTSKRDGVMLSRSIIVDLIKTI